MGVKRSLPLGSAVDTPSSIFHLRRYARRLGYATGTRRLPFRRFPSKLCATLVLRGDCAWTDNRLFPVNFTLAYARHHRCRCLSTFVVSTHSAQPDHRIPRWPEVACDALGFKLEPCISVVWYKSLGLFRG